MIYTTEGLYNLLLLELERVQWPNRRIFMSFRVDVNCRSIVSFLDPVYGQEGPIPLPITSGRVNVKWLFIVSLLDSVGGQGTQCGWGRE